MSNLKKYTLNEIPHYKVHGRTVPGSLARFRSFLTEAPWN